MITISNIGTMTRNNWILETPAGIIAVDTGLPGEADGFLERFCKRWRKEELAYLFLTHAHIDHAGFAEELLNKTAARLLAGEKSLAALKAGRYDGKYVYKNWLGKVLDRYTRGKRGGYPPISDSYRITVADDAFFEKAGIAARVIALPGHTRDSIGLYLPENNAVLCGDAAMNRRFFNSNRHTVLIESIEDFYKSWDTMTGINPDLIYPGHGEVFPAGDLTVYRDWVK
ncbi:MAG: MBL fold metallo-hydrolase [Oscillospiraceae bacterium]|jgi:glyoxylase-like metal-dependent hydrolase (beta-lactamase superfamily II)|nr:MBL fold metallo-hydrolase [Oscillospiraceae bacterium]